MFFISVWITSRHATPRSDVYESLEAIFNFAQFCDQLLALKFSEWRIESRGLSRRQFTTEHKLAAVRRLEQGLSIDEAAEGSEVDPGLLQRLRRELGKPWQSVPRPAAREAA